MHIECANQFATLNNWTVVCKVTSDAIILLLMRRTVAQFGRYLIAGPKVISHFICNWSQWIDHLISSLTKSDCWLLEYHNWDRPNLMSWSLCWVIMIALEKKVIVTLCWLMTICQKKIIRQRDKINWRILYLQPRNY